MFPSQTDPISMSKKRGYDSRFQISVGFKRCRKSGTYIIDGQCTRRSTSLVPTFFPFSQSDFLSLSSDQYSKMIDAIAMIRCHSVPVEGSNMGVSIGLMFG